LSTLPARRTESRRTLGACRGEGRPGAQEGVGLGGQAGKHCGSRGRRWGRTWGQHTAGRSRSPCAGLTRS
jgi:hypothetical protein